MNSRDSDGEGCENLRENRMAFSRYFAANLVKNRMTVSRDFAVGSAKKRAAVVRISDEFIESGIVSVLEFERELIAGMRIFLRISMFFGHGGKMVNNARKGAGLSCEFNRLRRGSQIRVGDSRLPAARFPIGCYLRRFAVDFARQVVVSGCFRVYSFRL